MLSEEHYKRVLKASNLETLLIIEDDLISAINIWGKEGTEKARELLKQIQDEIATRKIKTI